MLGDTETDDIWVLFLLVKALALILTPCCPPLIIVFLIARKYEPK